MNLVGTRSNLLRSPLGFTRFDHVTNQVHEGKNMGDSYSILSITIWNVLHMLKTEENKTHKRTAWQQCIL